MTIPEMIKAAVGGNAPDKVPGVVIACSNVKTGKTVFYYDGYADLATGRKMTPDTMFWVASNTKAVAAALVLMLVDEGKLSLDDPVEKFFPSWAKIVAKKRPTLRMLLSHQSGLHMFPGHTGGPFIIDRRPVRELVELAPAYPLDYEPTTKYQYCNWGIDTAMAIVEKVTGRTFDELMAERIFRPLNMVDTTFYLTESQFARLATSYAVSPDKAPVPKTIDYCTYPYGREGRFPEAGGGLFSTPADMDKFFCFVAANGVTPSGKRLLSEAAMNEWFTPQKRINEDSEYSLGMGISADRASLSHGGAYWTFGRANRVTGETIAIFMSIVGANAGSTLLRELRTEKTIIGSGNV